MEMDEEYVKNALERAWVDGNDYAQRTGRTSMSGIKEYINDSFAEIVNDGSTDKRRIR